MSKFINGLIVLTICIFSSPSSRANEPLSQQMDVNRLNAEVFPESNHEYNMIRSIMMESIAENWVPAFGSGDILVKLQLTLNKDGSIKSIKPLDVDLENASHETILAHKSAMRAIYRSAPFKDLPPELYDVKEGWKEVVVTLDSKPYDSNPSEE